MTAPTIEDVQHQPGARQIVLDDAERTLLLEALAGYYARTAEPAAVTAAMRLAQRLEGFDIYGRDGSRPVAETTAHAAETPT